MKMTLLPALLLGWALLLSNHADARMITVNSSDEYTKYYQGDTPLITMYSAEWCGPCKQMKPHFYAAAEAASDIIFCVIDTEAKAFSKILSDIRSIPTTILSHKGKQINRTSGGLTRTQIDTSINELRSKTRQEQPKATQPIAPQKK